MTQRERMAYEQGRADERNATTIWLGAALRQVAEDD